MTYLSGERWELKISLHDQTNAGLHLNITQYYEDFDARITRP